MFEIGENVQVTLSQDSLDVYRLMGDKEPWFQNKRARVTGLVYEHREDNETDIQRFWRVEFYGNSGTEKVLSEEDLMRL